MASSSWVRTITSPIKKACTFFSPQHHHHRENNNTPKKSHHVQEQEQRVMALQGEVMACGYEDVQVMWSMLDMKSKPRNYDLTSS